MKILHVISAPAAGGVEVYIKDLAKAMTKNGHVVHIGFLDHAEDLGRSVEFEKNFLNELRVSGIQYFFIGHEARRFPWLGMIRVRRYVEQSEIEIYHAHLTYGIAFGAFVSVPRIYTHHSYKMRVSRTFFFLLDLFPF